MKGKTSTTFSLELELPEKINKAYKKHGYRNNSHLVEEAIKALLIKLEKRK